MSCQATRERLLELDVQDFHQVEHLAVCASCRVFADAAEEVFRAGWCAGWRPRPHAGGYVLPADDSS